MVASVLRNFGRRVRHNPQPSVVPGFLRPIDTQLIAADLNIEKEGIERAKRELPAAQDQIFDSTEQAIVQKIESEWGWQGEELLNQLSAYASRLLGYSIPAEFERLRLMAENAMTRLRSATQQAIADLGPRKDTFVASRNELTLNVTVAVAVTGTVNFVDQSLTVDFKINTGWKCPAGAHEEFILLRRCQKAQQKITLPPHFRGSLR